jgi:methylenetetrahydrofolate reductase (NADPH)
MTEPSRLERVLRSGRFAVTAELNPPDSADPAAVYDRALVLATVCDAINATDASGANVHMSSVGVCALLTRAGYEPVLQVSCRDRNRIAIQGDLLGAAAMGVRNVLCLTGDGVQAGDQPEAKPVFDLDSTSLLRTARMLRDQGRFLSGRPLQRPGISWAAMILSLHFRPARPAAGQGRRRGAVHQTQYCFDVPPPAKFMAQSGD